MKSIRKMMLIAGIGLSLTACNEKKDDFKYSVDQFADIEVLKYQVPRWDDLTFNQKEYIYHLGEAAKYGRDITWDQNFKYNLRIRHILEDIIEKYDGDRQCEEWDQFMVYAKRVFFSNGIHHHYADDKIIPECGREYLLALMDASGIPAEEGDLMSHVMCDEGLFATKRCQEAGKDLVKESAVNFYEGVTADEVNSYYEKMIDLSDPHPVSYGLNSKLVKVNGQIQEVVYKADGLYGNAIFAIINELQKAAEVAENDTQRKYIAELIEYYKTGDLKMWDQYNISWVEDTESDIDFVNGFVENYGDPLGRKAHWEGVVNYRDNVASNRTKTISDNAQWFEDNSPVDPRFKKEKVKGVSAKVINVAVIAGDSAPATAIGINLPNSSWIRKEYGSKSVTIANITNAYDEAAAQAPKSVLTEFAWDQREIELCKKYGNITDNLHTDLHECLGHGSGQKLQTTPPKALKEYSSAIEEARADLFALYYLADRKLVELGLLDDKDAYKAEYMSYIRNGLFTQFTRIEPGKKNTEAHMQNRKLIAEWCYEKGREDNVIEKKVREGKTYFVINDFDKLRGLFGELLKEIQRITSEGDFEAAKHLIQTYAIDIDPELHREVLERYAALGLKPYKGFVNPDIVPVEKNGRIVDYKIVYVDDFLQQQLDYGKKYKTL